MQMYTTLMTAYGVSAGIDYKFGGQVANTLQAHRVIQHFQEQKGPEVADRIVNCTLCYVYTFSTHPPLTLPPRNESRELGEIGSADTD
jgi:hypothetical protein